jgi:hypothetical protein
MLPSSVIAIAQVIHRNRQRLAVKVAAGEHLDRAGRLIDEQQRIVRHRIQFDLHCPACIGDGVAHGAMHLRNAAQRVGVLHVGRVSVAGEFAAGQQFAQISRAVDLAWEGAQCVDARIESQRRAVQRLQAQAAGDVGDAAQGARPPRFERAQRRHHGRAVGERQSFFGGQRRRRQSFGRQRGGADQHCAIDLGLAHPDQHQRHVRQRRQVAAGAERAFLRDDGMHAAIEQFEQQLQRRKPHAGVPARQRVGAD